MRDISTCRRCKQIKQLWGAVWVLVVDAVVLHRITMKNRSVAAQEPLKLGFSPGSSFEILRRWEIDSKKPTNKKSNCWVGNWAIPLSATRRYTILLAVPVMTHHDPTIGFHQSHDQFLLFSQMFRWGPGIAGTAVSGLSSCESWQAPKAAKDHLRNATSKHKESPGSNYTD